MDKLKLDLAIVLKEYSSYDFQSDERLLIPFMLFNKIGFFNRQGECIVEPKYDTYIGDIYSETDLIKIGIRHSYAYERRNRHPDVYTRYNYGIMNAKGECIIEPQYSGIRIGANSFIVRRAYGYDYDGALALLDPNGDTIIPFGEYSIIDEFEYGLARVKVSSKSSRNPDGALKWGIINEVGEEVLAAEYDDIWKFYGRHRNSTKVIKDGIESEVYFKDLNPVLSFDTQKVQAVNHESSAGNFDNDYGTHYGEFAGSYAQDVMGFSDDVINDAFEGDPDAYWNID